MLTALAHEEGEGFEIELALGQVGAVIGDAVGGKRLCRPIAGKGVSRHTATAIVLGEGGKLLRDTSWIEGRLPARGSRPR